ncbi:hypothetical protein RB25_25925 [Herbaspirillum rubrisubalbicans]|jgi:hypothetical protein|uniref:DUF1640 domain-containing protein n=2 Tax=Herbaspirillum rubrisubalbicans TaxID=80842 RepID=A0AAD0XFS5_9BURK|nr:MULTISPECIES: DUF1640 domain-containing protein [Herbaspirillum]AYR24516.1 DUF1640 domain-containing protein [Herbaspirillum rubrisubalbicans]MBP1313381.1 hypothetical protein [Herbaspirillum sp. 1130]MCP1572486.1 hypothetical protein [Herbaspirillum rubrisubalbicans]MDR6738622.1 hypothetical protein [Herbaspirillum sp. 1173]QJQ01115.1 DUF1640 domain-containing protein [Herbaspirillum rubrisubalbicans Os34]
MATTLFDTHEYVKRLEATGVPTEQAEAHATALAEAMNNELVKKADLTEFRAEVRGQFELLKWMLGFMLAGTVGILFKIFH